MLQGHGICIVCQRGRKMFCNLEMRKIGNLFKFCVRCYQQPSLDATVGLSSLLLTAKRKMLQNLSGRYF